MQIGRSPDNDIVIASVLVSHHHLRVNAQGGQITVTDLSSTNGTLLNGARIIPNQGVPLHLGDVLRIGDLNGNSIQVTYGRTSEAGLRTQSVGKLDLAKLATQPSVLIGRLPTCDLCMPHPNVSKNHAMVTRQDGEISIRDLGSRNGTYVNGVRISQARLHNGDEIQIGPFRLAYDGRMHNLTGSRAAGSPVGCNPSGAKGEGRRNHFGQCIGFDPVERIRCTGWRQRCWKIHFNESLERLRTCH